MWTGGWETWIRTAWNGEWMTADTGDGMSPAPADSVRPEVASASFWDRYYAASASVRQPARLPYIAALDGIRAIAVIAVLLYHSGYRWIPGGFLGVEIFFVLSGYLITSLLLGEWRAAGTVDLKSFWIRRARRLLPALYLLLAVTLTYAVVMLPDQVSQLRGDAAAALFYVTNWWLIFGHKSYFEVVGRPSLFTHLWSLAVEEQFYLIWPPIFGFAITRFRQRRVLIGVIAAALVSTVLMAFMYDPAVDPSRLYYGTDTRAAELLVGVALAFVWQPGQPMRWPGKYGQSLLRFFGQGQRVRVVSEVCGGVALASLGMALWKFGELSRPLYQGGFLFVALATALLIAVVVQPGARFVSGALGCRPLTWIGLRSYGIYLWHWPIFMITRPGVDVPLHGIRLLGLRILLTLLLVEVSYRAVETPFRSGQVARIWQSIRGARTEQPRLQRAVWLGVSGTVAMSTVVLGILVATAKPTQPPDYLSVQEVHISASPSRTPTPTPIAATPTPRPDTPTAVVSIVIPDATRSSAGSGATPRSQVPAATPTPAPTPTPTATPSPTPTPQPTTPPDPLVTAVGDSVMVGAADDLVNDVPNLDLDAKVGMQVSEAIQILTSRASAGELGNFVVVDIGNNGPITAKEFDQIMSIAGSDRDVIFMTVRVPRVWEAPNNQVLIEGASRYANASLIDWYSLTIDHPEIFWDDGIHLRPEGATMYAQLIAAQIQVLK